MLAPSKILAHFEEQCVCVKLCFKLGKTATEIEMLKLVFRDEAISRTKDISKFESGVASVDAERAGRPSTSKTD